VTTVKNKILHVLRDAEEAMSSEEIFLMIRKNLDFGVRMLTVERVLYSLVKDGILNKNGNSYKMSGLPTEAFDWL